VAVIGLGAIGLVAVQMARLAGADPVIGLDLLPGRRAIAEELGADLTIDPSACDAGLAIREATGGRGADVAIEYSGATAAVQTALRGVAYGGTVVLGAYPPAYGPGLDFGAEAHHNIPQIIFSRACSQPDRDHPRWDNARIYAHAWKLLCEGRISGDRIVDPVVPFETLIDVYPRIPGHPSEYLKLGASF
jgi:threonine dehydrogenase-like Zn-dependent dehydrogenase